MLIQTALCLGKPEAGKHRLLSWPVRQKRLPSCQQGLTLGLAIPSIISLALFKCRLCVQDIKMDPRLCVQEMKRPGDQKTYIM